MSQDKKSDRIVGSLVVGSTIRCFIYDLTAERLELDTPPYPYPNQATLDPAQRERFESEVRATVGAELLEIRCGEHRCTQCRRWIDVTKFGNWSRSICAQCSLDRGSELHEYYATAPPRKPAVPSAAPGKRPDNLTARSAQPPVRREHDRLGRLIHLARASRNTNAINLLCLLGGVTVTAVIWPEFEPRFGGLLGFAAILWHNPALAAPWLIPVVATCAAAWALWRMVYYLRLRVEVRKLGIRIRPGGRQAFWEEIRYANRRLRRHGVLGRPRESLQLRLRDQRPINLSHRFGNVGELISTVRSRIEPRMIEQAFESLRRVGSVSFGPLLTVMRDRLLLGRNRQELPLEQIKSCGVRAGQFLVLDHDGKLHFVCGAETIPNATIIGPLVQQLGEHPPGIAT